MWGYWNCGTLTPSLWHQDCRSSTPSGRVWCFLTHGFFFIIITFFSSQRLEATQQHTLPCERERRVCFCVHSIALAKQTSREKKRTSGLSTGWVVFSTVWIKSRVYWREQCSSHQVCLEGYFVDIIHDFIYTQGTHKLIDISLTKLINNPRLIKINYLSSWFYDSKTFFSIEINIRDHFNTKNKFVRAVSYM